jgi:hypothetical protein
LEFHGFASVPFDPAVDVKIHEAKHAVGLAIEEDLQLLGVVFMV